MAVISETIGSAVAGASIAAKTGQVVTADIYTVGAGNNTFVLEKSYDNGVNWITCQYQYSTALVNFNNVATGSTFFDVPEPALYRFRCSSWTAGSKFCRIGVN